MKAALAIGMLSLLAAPAAAAPAEIAELGRRLAQTGHFQAILKLGADAETQQLLAAHPELADADKAALADTAREQFEAGREKLLAAAGAAYADAFTIDELTAMVAFFGSPAGRAYNAKFPAIAPALMKAMEGMDFKADVKAAFCRRTGKLCAKTPPAR